MPSLLKKAKPYPYQILPVPKTTDLRKVDSWSALEFFRAEALLRSDVVASMYRKKVRDHTLMKKFAISWNVLQGEHHRFLITRHQSFTHLTPAWYEKQCALAQRLQEFGIDASPPRLPDFLGHSIVIEISQSSPPERVIAALRTFLKAQHTHSMSSPGKLTIWEEKGKVMWITPSHPRKLSPIRDIRAWVTYFRCYDLHEREGLSLANTAAQVSMKPDHVKNAVRRVKALIRAAEQINWPPSPSLLN